MCAVGADKIPVKFRVGMGKKQGAVLIEGKLSLSRSHYLYAQGRRTQQMSLLLSQAMLYYIKLKGKKHTHLFTHEEQREQRG